MSVILLSSIGIRLAALFWSLILLKQMRDWRMAFLSVMIAFMALRQVLTLLETPGTWTPTLTWHTSELPGLVVSIMGLLAIFFLKAMLDERDSIIGNLRISEQRHRDTVNFLPQIIIEADREGHITFVNQSGLDLLGEIRYPRGRIRHLFELAVPGEQARGASNIQRVLKGESIGPNEYSFITKDGATFPALVYSAPILTAGKVTGIRSLVVDYSQQKLAELELRASERRLREAQSVAEIGSWEYNLATDAITWSDEVFRIYKLEPRDICPTLEEILAYVHPDDRVLVDETYAAYARHCEPYEINYRLRFADGEVKHVNERGQTLYDEADHPVVSFGTFQDTTRYRQVQIDLLESEEKYRTLVESSPYCIHQIDLDGRILSMNEAGLRMLGYGNESDIVGLPYLDVIRRQGRDRIASMMDAAFAGQYSEFEFTSADDRVYRSNFVPLFNSNREVDRLFGITQDITESKRAELAVQESEARFRGIFEQAAVGVALIDAKSGALFRINRYFCDMLGYDADYISEIENFYKITHAHDLRKELENRRRLENREIDGFTMDKRYIHRNGSTVWASLTVSSIQDDAGETPYYLAIVQDITERKQAEDELRILSQGIEASSSSVTITDGEGIIEYVNPKFTEITGYSREEVLGKKISMMRSGETPESTYAELRDTIYAGGVWKGEVRDRRKDGSLYWNRVSITGIRNAEGEITHVIGNQEDVTHEYELSEKLSYQATHDALTGLVNRGEFERRAERMLASTRVDRSEHALCYMDLDQFKVVNDTCGHAAGDEMMRQLSALLQLTVRKRDTLARLGGDEFGVLMEHCSPDHAHRVASNLQKVIQDYQFAWEGHVFRVGVSIGLVAVTEVFPNLSELLKQADAACYMAKDLGRNRIHVYHGEDASLARRHGEMQWVTRIYRALEQDRLRLFAQIIVPLDNSDDVHYELLLRMQDEDGKLIPPGAFLPAAERYNLIDQLDAWVIENAFRMLAANPVFLNQVQFISINLSGQSLAKATFLDIIVAALDRSAIEAHKICFEITETTAITNLSAASTFISTLKGLGCQFALDDFGSGLSSFGYLKNLPVDYLKIDGIFVKDIVEDPIDRAMVKSINEIGHVMGMQTIAEFVENDEIKGMLREIGVDYAQGYGIGKPQPFIELLGRARNITSINKR